MQCTMQSTWKLESPRPQEPVSLPHLFFLTLTLICPARMDFIRREEDRLVEGERGGVGERREEHHV